MYTTRKHSVQNPILHRIKNVGFKKMRTTNRLFATNRGKNIKKTKYYTHYQPYQSKFRVLYCVCRWRTNTQISFNDFGFFWKNKSQMELNEHK